MAKIDELINPSWLGDVKLLARDWYLLIKDFIGNLAHLIARTVKVVTAMQVWGKGLASWIETKLHDLRSKLWG